MRLQKVDRKAFDLPKPYFNFGPTPGIASVILKVLHLYQKKYIKLIQHQTEVKENHNAGKSAEMAEFIILQNIKIRNIFYLS